MKNTTILLLQESLSLLSEGYYDETHINPDDTLEKLAERVHSANKHNKELMAQHRRARTKIAALLEDLKEQK